VLRLGDELSPDGCRLQDAATGQSLDKDVFRKGTDDLIETYQTLANKLAKAPWDLSKLPTQAYTGVVVVQSRANILNPQSRTLTHALQQAFTPDASIPTGFGSIRRVDSQKRFQVSITATHHWQALALLNQLAEEPLSNPVIEDASVEEITFAKESV
jgi:phosphoribosylformylglycinamidine (FGAM) synthase PurS component